jgi:amino acid transporter
MSTENSLAKNVLTTRHVAIVSMAAAGPGASVALNFGAMGAFAGPAFVISTVIVLGAVLVLANTMVRLSHRYQSAGGLYTWAVRAFGPRTGFVFGWLFGGSYALLTAAGFVVIGYWGTTLASSLWGVSIPWWIWSVAGLVLVTGLAFRGIAQSVQSAFILFAIEFVVILALSIYAIAASRHPWVPQAFRPSSAPAGAGWVGIGLAMTFGVLSCVGVEESATLAEETRNAHRSIGRGVLLAAVIIPIIYVICAYAVDAGLGPAAVSKFNASTANPLGDMTTKYWGAGFGSWIVYIAALSSMLAFTQTAFNATTRVLFSLGRERLLPARLARVHPKFKTPHVAIVAVTLASVAIGFPIAFNSGPLTVWIYLGFMISVMFLIVYALTNVALIVDTYRNHREKSHWLTTVLLPSVGFIAMAYPLYRTVYPLPTAPFPLLAALVAGWVLLGMILMVWLVRKRPEELLRAGLVMAVAEEGIDIEESVL